NGVSRKLDQVGRRPPRVFDVGQCRAVFVTDALPFDPAQLVHLLTERGNATLKLRIRFDDAVDNADTPDALRLRACCRDANSHRAAESGDKGAPPQPITSSVRASGLRAPTPPAPPIPEMNSRRRIAPPRPVAWPSLRRSASLSPGTSAVMRSQRCALRPRRA